MIEKINKNAKVIWLTGLSGSGKTTLALALEEKLKSNNYFVVVLDGDLLRTGINSNLGFETIDRVENIRRVAEVAKLFLQANIITIVAVISPQEKMREMARNIISESNFIEVYVNASLETCEKRDVKGLYMKARAGIIKKFTGISDIYEIPKSAFEINSESLSIEEASTILYKHIQKELEK